MVIKIIDPVDMESFIYSRTGRPAGFVSDPYNPGPGYWNSVRNQYDELKAQETSIDEINEIIFPKINKIKTNFDL